MADAEGFVLATARSRLRPCTADDVDDLHGLWTEPLVRRWLWDDVVIDRDTAADRVAASAASFAASGWGLWVVEPIAPGGWLGAVGLLELDPAVGPELVYALRSACRGRGFAVEAARAVLGHAFRTLGLARVPARTDAPNQESIRVLERLGMRFEGETRVAGRPTRCYALDREDFLRADPSASALSTSS